MYLPALLQMTTRDPMFWILVIIAASFIVIAIAIIAMAIRINEAAIITMIQNIGSRVLICSSAGTIIF